tara:strand:- start:556 stop:1122 length:567 start_codon:yes stop_codon:yes gene_type:complete
MWKYNNRIIRQGRAWTDDEGYQHPKNWAMWDTPTKASRGLTWEDEAAPYDNRFYYGRDSDGNLIEKSLTDTLWVDDDGNAVIDQITGAQGITDGLKSKYIKETKKTANSLLAPTDWMVVRKAEDSSKNIASKYTTYRAAIRTACAAIEQDINDCSSLDEFMALWDTPVDSDNQPTGNAPINNWPDVVE